jgi:hypothetical protein
MFYLGDTIKINKKIVDRANYYFQEIGLFKNKGFVIANRYTKNNDRTYTIQLYSSSLYFPKSLYSDNVISTKILLTERKIFGYGI